MSEESPKLLKLARKKFATRNLSLAEEKLFRAAQIGEITSALAGDEEQDDPAHAASWHADRAVGAESIVWLCTDRAASALVTHRGIQIHGMRIDGDLELSHAEVKFPLGIQRCAFMADIILRRAQLPMLSLSGSHIKRLAADGMRVAHGVFLDSGFKSEGEVRLAGATIGGDLVCNGARLSNPNGGALGADRARIEGNVFLRAGFQAEGEVRLPGVTIGRNLECDGAVLLNPQGESLIADGVRIGGSVFLRAEFKSYGRIRFVGATIGQGFSCDAAWLNNPQGEAFSLEDSKISGGLLFRNRTRVDGKATLAGAEFNSLQIIDLLEPDKAVFDLRATKVGGFWDDENSWPKAGNLSLDGFRYERFEGESPVAAKIRVNWLRRQPRDNFFPQPYEQLAGVLRQMGHERDARLIMIEKNRAHGRFSRFFGQRWWWYNFFGRIIGYGYAPWRAFAMSVAMIILGTSLFSYGSSHGLISPTKESAYEKSANGQFMILDGKRKFASDYPVFVSFVYSLETFTPLIKLDQRENWTPNANCGAKWRIWIWEATSGEWLRRYLWFHILAGWILTTLWVGAVTGLVKS